MKGKFNLPKILIILSKYSDSDFKEGNSLVNTKYIILHNSPNCFEFRLISLPLSVIIPGIFTNRYFNTQLTSKCSIKCSPIPTIEIL